MLRRPERLTLVGVTMWALAIGVTVFVVAGSIATLSSGEISGTTWTRLVVAGLSTGAIYALIALGYTLVYGVLLMINFAHGEVFMLGAFGGMFAADALLGPDGPMLDQPVLGLLVVFLVAMLTSMLVALTLERVAYRPLRGAPRLVPLITAIGASLFLQYTAFGMFGPRTQRYPSVEILEGRVNLFGLDFARIQIVTIVAAIVLMAILYYVVERTRTGRSMRAVSEDKDVASLMGINVDRTIVTTFAIGGVLAGAAAVLYAFLFLSVDFGDGRPARHQGLHRRRPRRHRQHRRRDGRRHRHRRARDRRPDAHPHRLRGSVSGPAQRRRRLRRPRAGAHRPPDRPLRAQGEPLTWHGARSPYRFGGLRRPDRRRGR